MPDNSFKPFVVVSLQPGIIKFCVQCLADTDTLLAKWIWEMWYLIKSYCEVTDIWFLYVLYPNKKI